MRNEKGFTIIELLITIVIIGVIAGLSFTIYNVVHKNAINKLLEAKIVLIENSAEKWAENANLNSSITITVNKLIIDGYLESDNKKDEIINPVTNEVMNCQTIYIEYSKNNANAEFLGIENCGLVEQEQMDRLIDIQAFELIDNNVGNQIKNNNGYLDWTNKNVRLKLIAKEEYENNYSRIRWYQNGNLIETDKMQATLDVKATLFLNSIFTVSLDVNNLGVKSSNVQVKIDKEIPIVLKTEWNNEWENTLTKKVTINATDSLGSGVASYYFSQNAVLENVNWIELKNENNITFNFDASKGKSYLWIKDKVGNISDVNFFEINTLDTTKPVISNTFTTYSSTFGNTYYSALTRMGTATDSESGITSIKYCTTTGSSCEPTSPIKITTNISNITFNMPFTTSNKTAQRMCAKASDVAGNDSNIVCDNTFNVDITAPTGVSASFNANNILQVSGIDNESGIWKYICQYSIGNTTYNSSVSAIANTCNFGTLPAGKIVYARVVGYNNANLTTISAGTSIKIPGTTIQEAYNKFCGGTSYCTNGFYVKFKNARNSSFDTYVVYGNLSGGYKAALNSIYKNSAYCSSSMTRCRDERYTFGSPNNIFVILSGEFLNTLPANYTSYINHFSWNIGRRNMQRYEYIRDYPEEIENRNVSSYAGLMDNYEYYYVGGSAAVKDNVTSYWLSNSLYQASASSDGPDYTECARSSSAGIACKLVGLSNGYLTYNSSKNSLGVRPVIAFKSGILFTGGSGTKADPYIIE